MNKLLPILFVESYPQALAGQQETLTTLLNRGPQWGIASTILMPGKGIFADRLIEQGRTVEIISQPDSIATYGGAIYQYSLLRKAHMVMNVFGYVAQLRRYLRAHHFGAIFCNDMRGLLTVGLAAKLVGIPVIIWDKLDKPHGFYDIMQLPLVSRNLMISESVIQKYPAWQRWVWKKRIKVVRNGIDLNRFHRTERKAAREKLGLNNSDIVLAIVGTITKRKGHDLLFAALRKAQIQDPRLLLLVIGESNDASVNFAEEIRAAAPKRIQWLGYRSDIETLLPAIDIMVSPSRHEGMGRVNVEAMATEIPVIGSANTGIAEVVLDGETGFLVDPEDSDALSNAILRLSGDAALRARFGKAARARTEIEFNVIKQIDVVLEEIVSVARP